MSNCNQCGAEVRPGTTKCAYCGAAVAGAVPPAPPAMPAMPAPYQPAPAPMAAGVEQKSKIVAGVLGILLGSLGIHNFYLGHTGKGVAQLLISLLTCGYGAIVSWIWALVESISILTGSTKVDARGVPLKD